MELLEIISQDEVLSGNEERKIIGLLQMAGYNDFQIMQKYEEMKSDIKEFKDKFGNEIVNLDRIYYKWEVELFKKWGAAKVKNNNLIVLKEKTKMAKSTGRETKVVFMFYFLSKLLSIYKDKLAYAKELDSREVLGDEGYEEKIRESRNKIRQNIKGMTFEKEPDEFSIEGLKKSGREHDEQAEREREERPKDDLSKYSKEVREATENL